MNIHDTCIDHILECATCMRVVSDMITQKNARKAGSTTSDAKSQAARENGKKGGRPRKK